MMRWFVHTTLIFLLTSSFGIEGQAARSMNANRSPGFIHTVAFPLAFQSGPASIRIPFRRVGRLIAVQAIIEGQKGIFFVDTGASKLVLNNQYFEGVYRVQGIVGGGTTGQFSDVSRRIVDTLQWDNFIFTNYPADVIDLKHLEDTKNIQVFGLIGYDVLKDFEIFFDFESSQLVLTRLDKAGEKKDSLSVPEMPVDSVDFDLRRYVIILNGEVNGVPVKFGLDSGAELNLLHHKIDREVLDHFEVIKRVKLLGTGQEKIETIAGRLFRYSCGNIKCGGMRTLLTNMNTINKTYQTRLDGIIGYEFLSDKRVAINYKKKKLYFYKTVKF